VSRKYYLRIFQIAKLMHTSFNKERERERERERGKKISDAH
jgi:hypothetical protein